MWEYFHGARYGAGACQFSQSYSPLLPDRGSSLYSKNEEALKKWAYLLTPSLSALKPEGSRVGLSAEPRLSPRAHRQLGARPYGSNARNPRVEDRASVGGFCWARDTEQRGSLFTKHVKKSWRRLRTLGGAGEIGWSRTGRDETNKSPWPVFGSNNNKMICLNGADSCIVRRV